MKTKPKAAVATVRVGNITLDLYGTGSTAPLQSKASVSSRVSIMPSTSGTLPRWNAASASTGSQAISGPGTLVTGGPAQRLDSPRETRMVERSAVPRQQKVHRVNCRQCQMGGIRCRDRRDDPAREQIPRERIGLRRLREFRQTIHHRPAFACHLRIAFRDLIENHCGDEKLLILTAFLPPVLRRLLLSGDPRQRTAPRDEIARDGRFDVETRQAHHRA